jgi:hypothetical protein
MSASQILLAGHGPEDRWLTESPNRTYFEAKYQSHVNRLRETYEVPFDNQDATFDSTGRCTIPVKGDYLTSLTLRAVLPPIYPTVPGQYVYPTPSSQVGGNVYVNMGLTQVDASGGLLTANTTGSHYFSVGAEIVLSGTGTLDGLFTILTIPTANSFTCSMLLTGTSTTGTASVIGVTPSDVVGYFSTSNFNLWLNNLTNKTWSVTNAVFNGPGTEMTVTTSTPSGFSVGQDVNLIISSLYLNGTYTVISATDTTFTISLLRVATFVAVGDASIKSTDGDVWDYASEQIYDNWQSVTFGNGTFVAVSSTGQVMHSPNGDTWTLASVSQGGNWVSVTYGAGTFVAVGFGGVHVMHSTDGDVWVPASVPQSGDWYSVTYGAGTFVAVGDYVIMHSTDGDVWVPASIPQLQFWQSVTYGDGKFVAIQTSSGATGAMYSTDGDEWFYASPTPFSLMLAVTYGGGIFVAVGFNFFGNTVMHSDNGIDWYIASTTLYGYWQFVTYGENGRFVAKYYSGTMYSDDGDEWYYSTNNINSGSVVYGVINYTFNAGDLVYLAVAPLVITPTPTQFTFSSSIYPSMSFGSSAEAAFWGFDSRDGLTYSFPVTTSWTYTQGGWVAGFLPPSLSTWDDSVAHKLVREARILIGKQTIKRYTGAYIEIQNDLTVSYENKAVLKLMNGTLDQTQATAAREYYTTLPIGTREIPLCALTHQQMSVEIDFESFTNLSQNLNPGTGDFLDAKSYLTSEVLNGTLLNVMATLSYQQYVFILTYDGSLIIYNTTQPINVTESYIVITAFVGQTGLFSQFCVLGGVLYIQLINGYIVKGSVDELINGNTSSFVSNNYLPTDPGDIGPPTGTLLADARYLYYAQSNLAQSNVFLVRYDTQSAFDTSTGYTSFDFTSTIDSTVTSVNQMVSTGSQLVALTNTIGKFYIFNLNADFEISWNSVDFIDYTLREGPCIITEGVLIGTNLYFITNVGSLIVYSQGVFSQSIPIVPYSLFAAVDSYTNMHSLNGSVWSEASNTPPDFNWFSVTYGNGTFVTASSPNIYIKYSFDGDTWSYSSVQPVISPGGPFTVTFGNGLFVVVNYNGSAYSSDGDVWVSASVSPQDDWTAVTYGDGMFVAVGSGGIAMHSTNGDVWTRASVIQSGNWNSVTYGDGMFVAVGNSGVVMHSTNGDEWDPASAPQSGNWLSVTYGNGLFVAVKASGAVYSGDAMYSTNGDVWYSASLTSPEWSSVTYGDGKFIAVSLSGPAVASYSVDGDVWVNASVTSPSLNGVGWNSVTYGTNTHTQANIAPNLKNLHAVGSKIYASSNSLSVSSVVEIDTTMDLNSPSAYKYYSSTDLTAPITFDGSAPKIFANGPRFLYMFSQGYPTAQDIIQFDPYPPVPVLQASILVDYESLPDGIKKPDKAFLGFIQTQRVTDMNFMNIRGPVKELWITGASASTNVFQYSNLSNQSTLALTAGEQIVTDDVGTRTFLNTIQAFETHTSMPIRNVSIVPFELEPESDVPNGTVNFSRIRDQVFNGEAETVWARKYNILAIQGGIGGLIFNS